MIDPIYPDLIVTKSRFVHLNNDGMEADGGIGVRVLLRYPNGSSEDRSFEIVDTMRQYNVAGMSPVQLMRYIQNRRNDMNEIIQFAEENIPHVNIGGERISWGDLEEQGYEYLSISRWVQPSKQVTLPRM